MNMALCGKIDLNKVVQAIYSKKEACVNFCDDEELIEALKAGEKFSLYAIEDLGDIMGTINLIKNFDENTCIIITNLKKMDRQRQGSMYRFKSNKIEYAVPYEDIIRIECNLKKKYIITSHKSYTVYANMNQILESITDSSFVQISTAIIVNSRHVEELTPDTVLMDDGRILAITKPYKERVRQKFKEIFG